MLKKIIKMLSGRGLGKYKILNKPYRFLSDRLHKDYAIVHGFKMHLDKQDTFNLSMNTNYDPEETKFIKENVKLGDVVVDLGANIGYFTLLISKLVGGSGIVYAFEPNPEVFKLLKRNIEENNIKNVVLENKAVGKINGKIKLYISKDNIGDHRIFESKENKEFVLVDCIRLDDYFKDKLKIDFIKSDTQGCEFMILQNATKILDYNKNIKMMLEFWPYGIKGLNQKPGDYIKFLKDKGLKFEVDYIPQGNDYYNLYFI